ncbi:MAG: bifunctional riboflavin kinase/FAD synthetase [Archangium sp.]|nr:bifunctional riboflavin kinase/FAD synthetase [Archangium sp.]
MKVFASIQEASNGELKGAAACLGNFDGVHLGHQALFTEAAKHGKVAAVTFLPHPGKVLQPQLAPRLIVLQARKLELLEAAGAAFVVVQPFTLDYAKSSPAQFEASLFDGLGVGAIVVGTDFTYGQKRAGTVATLTEAAKARGAKVVAVAPVTVEGVVVSSSKIREYVLEGRVEAAARFLSRPFDLEGVVVPGAGRGRTIGFPTANIDTANELRPAPGVYAIRVRVPGEETLRGGAANIGVKPTFGGGEVTIEAHLFDYSGDLYGQRLRVEFLERLRAEKRFGSADELSAQIARDLEAAREAVARSFT